MDAPRFQAAADPTDGAGKSDVVILRGAAHLVRCRFQAACLLGRHHRRFQRIEYARQTRRQTIGQQAESRVALAAIPASDERTLRRLALIGSVTGQRATAVRVIRAYGACPSLTFYAASQSAVTRLAASPSTREARP